jgi:hypothetical protein
MEVFLNSIKCPQCNIVLQTPIVLTCGHSICQSHVIKSNEKSFHCTVCDILHAIPVGGFSINIALESMLAANIQKAKFCSHYEQAFSSFKEFEKTLGEFKLLRNDAFYFINKTIGELKMETDLLREELKWQIDEKANEIIKELDEYELECKQNLSSSDEITNYCQEMGNILSRLGKEMDIWKIDLAKFDSDQDKWKKIKESSENEMKNLTTKMEAFKEIILMRRIDDFQDKLVEFAESCLPESYRK